MLSSLSYFWSWCSSQPWKASQNSLLVRVCHQIVSIYFILYSIVYLIFYVSWRNEIQSFIFIYIYHFCWVSSCLNELQVPLTISDGKVLSVTASPRIYLSQYSFISFLYVLMFSQNRYFQADFLRHHEDVIPFLSCLH